MPSFFSFFSFLFGIYLSFSFFFFFSFFHHLLFLNIFFENCLISSDLQWGQKKKKKKSTTYNWYRLGDHASSMDKTSCVPGSRQRHQRMKLRGVCQMFIIVGPLPEGLQYWADPWRGLSKPSAPRLRPKISLIS